VADRGNFGTTRCPVGGGKEEIYPVRVEADFVDISKYEN